MLQDRALAHGVRFAVEQRKAAAAEEFFAKESVSPRSGMPSRRSSTGRGWSREELYERGR